MIRPSVEVWGLRLAYLVASRGTCTRRQVGAVLLDRQGRVLATGYNGPPSGWLHCRGGTPCAGAELPSGTGLDLCQAIHAEQNALLQCRDPDRIDTCCVTATPCVTCIKLLLNTPCRRIVHAEEYPHGSAQEWWRQAGRTFVHIPNEGGDGGGVVVEEEWPNPRADSVLLTRAAAGLSKRQVARELGVTEGRVGRAAKRLGVRFLGTMP